MAAFGTTNVQAETMPTGSGGTLMSSIPVLQSCQFCQSAVGKQSLFFGAALLFAFAWHAHIYSLME